MSEAELYVIRARLQGGIMSKARRGVLKLPLPIGLCYTDDERIVLDPHLQVQATIRVVFALFAQTGSACATVRQFRQQQLSFPHRLRSGGRQGEVVWGTLHHHDVLRLLHHPAYAGASVFGRTRTSKTADGKIHIYPVPRDEWPVLRYDAHDGSSTWEEYERNQEQLAMNSQASAPKRFAPPREGPALLQGLIVCGRCGERMTVRYHQRAGRRIVPDYICQRAGIAQAQSPCQRIPGAALDRAVADLLLRMVTPEAMALIVALQEDVVQRAEEAQRLRHLQVERAQYEADLAQRRYLRVDPDNRLVAQVLEAEWNAKLRELAAAQEAEAQFRQSDAHPVSQQDRQRLGEIPERLAQFWQHPQTTARDRKRVVRLLIDDVTLQTSEQIVAHIRFKGGATQTLQVPFPPPFAQSRLTAPQTLEVMQRLLRDWTDAQTAEQLNALGYRTFTGLPFHAAHVAQLRRHHGLTDRYTTLREQGWLTASEIAKQCGISLPSVWRRYHHGLLVGAVYNDRGTCLFTFPAATTAAQ
jgi:Recombinase zinc beta ribbon domain/Recombinase